MLIVARDVKRIPATLPPACGGTLVLMTDHKCDVDVQTLLIFERIEHLEAPESKGKRVRAFLEGYLAGKRSEWARLGKMGALLDLDERVYLLTTKTKWKMPRVTVIGPQWESEVSEDEDSV